MTKFDGLKALKIEGNAESMVLDVPIRSQYDFSPYQNANCGPASLAMVLQAYGLNVPTERIRALANQFQGTYGFNEGVALDYLQAIGQQAGLREEGLYGTDGHYRRWAVNDVIREVRAGHPVITLVHYTSLPQHQGEVSPSDHYIVVIGVTDKGFLINDPASVGNAGYRQVLTPTQLMAAWKAASIPEQAVAFLAPAGTLVLNPANDETSDGPAAAGANTAKPSATDQPRPAAPQTSPTVVASATPRSTSTPSPTVNPAISAWADTLKDWDRQTAVPTVQPASPTSLPRPTATRTAPYRNLPSSPLPILGVLAAVGVGALGVLRGTRGELP